MAWTRSTLHKCCQDNGIIARNPPWNKAKILPRLSRLSILYIWYILETTQGSFHVELFLHFVKLRCIPRSWVYLFDIGCPYRWKGSVIFGWTPLVVASWRSDYGFWFLTKRTRIWFTCCRMKHWASSFTQQCSISLSCMNKYLAIDSGGICVCTVFSLRA